MKAILLHLISAILVLCATNGRSSLRGEDAAFSETEIQTLRRLIKLTSLTGEKISHVRSFTVEGRAHLDATSEFTKALSAGKTPSQKEDLQNELKDDGHFLVISKGSRLWGELKSAENAHGDIDRYYWDDVNVIWENRTATGASAAVISGKDDEKPFLEGLSGFLDEYAFLRSDVNKYGTPSWLATDLSHWQQLWEDASRHLVDASVKIAEDGAIDAQFKWPWGTACVTFKISDGVLFPTKTKLLDTKNAVIIDNEVLVYAKNATLGMLVATKSKVLVAKGVVGGGTIIIGLVTSVLEKIEFNTEIDDKLFKFDRGSVDEIVDHGIATTVPK